MLYLHITVALYFSLAIALTWCTGRYCRLSFYIIRSSHLESKYFHTSEQVSCSWSRKSYFHDMIELISISFISWMSALSRSFRISRQIASTWSGWAIPILISVPSFILTRALPVMSFWGRWTYDAEKTSSSGDQWLKLKHAVFTYVLIIFLKVLDDKLDDLD